MKQTGRTALQEIRATSVSHQASFSVTPQAMRRAAAKPTHHRQFQSHLRLSQLQAPVTLSAFAQKPDRAWQEERSEQLSR